ncbi:MAG: penicillin-binding transpeptidase domain-containing protein [Patescibacteria group bacterium]
MSFSWRKFVFWKRLKRRRVMEIALDEIMLDSSNLPDFDTTQFEGRLERPISEATLYGIAVVFLSVIIIFFVQAINLQIIHGDDYKTRSEKNLLRPIPIFAGRGIIMDRNGKLLSWNAPTRMTSDVSVDDQVKEIRSTMSAANEDTVATREYATSTGLAHVLGYVQYPSKDKNGFYYQEDFEGVSGIEKYYNQNLQGENGSRLIEVDARGSIVSENIVKPPAQGDNLTLSIDSRVQSALYKNIKDIADRVGFAGGAGIIMDVNSGEIITLTSYPEYSSQVMSDRLDTARVKNLLDDQSLPFLNRAVDGLYTPGSIVKPFIALGVLTEKIIDPATVIITMGSISLPNPYDSTKSTLFRDWKNNGPMDLRHAIQMSSDAYFYIIGGGYKDQKGLGIINIDKYLKLFGIGSLMPESFVQGKAGTIPTPDWKKKTFNEDWYVGDTYHTAIGQYGFQVTPIVMVRAIAALANSGTLLVPTIIKGEITKVDRIISEIAPKDFKIIHEGMRLSVLGGTSKALDVTYVNIAGKSGTAELGTTKEKVNSWISGFWPYENPKYAFVVMLEQGSVHNLIGAAAAMRQQLDWMNINTPEYFKK